MNTIEAVIDLIEMGAVEPGNVVKCLRSALQNDTAKDWQGLTGDEIDALWRDQSPYYDYQDFALAIEAKLREKNRV